MACLDDIIEQAGTILNKTEIRDLEKLLKARLRAYKGNRSPDDFLLRETEKIIADIKEAAVVQKRNAAFNVVIEKEALDFINRFEGDDAEGFETYLVGGSSKKAGSRDSVSSDQAAFQGLLLSDMVYQLRQEGLLEMLNNRALDKDIANELFAMKAGVEPKSVTGSDEAFRMAKIFKRTQDSAVQMQNDLGAWIRDLDGYIVKQGHDGVRIRRAGFDQYVKDLDTYLDLDRTLKNIDRSDPEAVSNFFKEVYADFVSGIHEVVNGAGDDFSAFRGPANIAKKASESRALHFKNADAWFEYNEKYGTGSVTESIYSGIRLAGNNAGLMKNLGTNPRAMFERIRNKLLIKNKTDDKGLKRLRRNRFNWFIDELDGSLNRPESVKWANFGAGARALINMARLGFVVVSSFNDVVTKAASLNRQSVGFLDAYKQGFDDIMKGRRVGEQREMADLLSEGFDGMLGAVFSRYNPQDSLDGKFSKATQLFFKLNLLNWWTDAHKTGASLILSRNLANNAKKSWAELPQGLRDSLGLYFDEPVWNMLRGTELRNADGKLYMTPDMVRDIPDQTLIDNFGPMSERELRLKRQELEINFRAYMQDSVDFAVLTPDAKIQAIAKGGTAAGSGMGETMRFFMQFKSFPMLFVQKGLGQFFADNKGFLKQLRSGKADRLGLVHLMLGTTVMGYMSMSAKDIIENRTPQDPSSPKTWGAAFLKGGAGGIYGDLLFGTSSRYNQGALSTMLGPGFGSASQILDLWNIARDPELENKGGKAASQAFRVVKGFVPLQNLFYSKWATDYLIMDRINETLNPGYKERTIRRIRENGQEQIIGGN